MTTAAHDRAMALIARVRAMPKTHAVVTTYACGKTRRFETQGVAQAENYASRERVKVGRKLIDRDTGATVMAVSVEVVPIQ